MTRFASVNSLSSANVNASNLYRPHRHADRANCARDLPQSLGRVLAAAESKDCPIWVVGTSYEFL